VAEGGDLFGVGSDDEVVELGAGAGCVVDPGEHGASGDLAEDLAGKTRGGQSRGDDSEDRDPAGRVLFARAGIKYDWSWL